MKASIFVFCVLFCVGITANAATVVINWSVTTEPGRRLVDRSFSPLSSGTGAAGDGTLVQLGYYDAATPAKPFIGKWVTLDSTTMGDDGIEEFGKFATSSTLGDEPFLAPAVGTPLAIRFFDDVSIGQSTYFNAASNTDGSWNFLAPDDPATVIDMVIDKAGGVVFRSRFFPFTTSIHVPVPEPTASLLAALGLSMVFLRRRRGKWKVCGR